MKGLEISTIALVDETYNTAYTLSVKQVPPSIEDSEENAIDFSVNHIKMLKQEHISVAFFMRKGGLLTALSKPGFMWSASFAKTPISGISMNRQSVSARNGGVPDSMEAKSTWIPLNCQSFPVT